MAVKLTERDIRALKIGGICAVGIVIFVFVNKWVEHWRQARRSLTQVQATLASIDIGGAKQEGLRAIVPVFEMPQAEEKQKFLFRNKLNEQLKQTGIKSKPLQILGTGRSRRGNYRLLRVQCSAKCRLEQVLDLLARLNENPYLVGVEEFSIECDKKNPREVQLELTVSTLVK